MHLLMSLQMALGALRQNRMRTALTMLGMIIGVGAVIAMVALGTGAQAQVEEQVRTTGTHLITVRAGNVSWGGVSQGMGAATTLTTADVEAIQRAVPGVQYLAAGVSSREQVVVGNRNWSTVIQGTDVALPDIRSWPIGVGGFFTRQHVQSAAKVAVLGSIVRAILFGEGSDPVGERVRIRGQVFTVIGVMTPKGSGAFGEDQDDVIFAPGPDCCRRRRRCIQQRRVSRSAHRRRTPDPRSVHQPLGRAGRRRGRQDQTRSARASHIAPGPRSASFVCRV